MIELPSDFDMGQIRMHANMLIRAQKFIEKGGNPLRNIGGIMQFVNGEYSFLYKKEYKFLLGLLEMDFEEAKIQFLDVLNQHYNALLLENGALVNALDNRYGQAISNFATLIKSKKGIDFIKTIFLHAQAQLKKDRPMSIHLFNYVTKKAYFLSPSNKILIQRDKDQEKPTDNDLPKTGVQKRFGLIIQNIKGDD